MSYSSEINETVDPFASDSERIRRSLKPVAAAVFLVSAALTAYGAHDLRETLTVTAVIAVMMVGIYGYLLPRKLAQESAGGTALTMSLVGAALLLPAFWSGLPLVLGVAGAVLGYAGKRARSGAGAAIAAHVIGIVVSIGYFAAYVLDTLHQYGIG